MEECSNDNFGRITGQKNLPRRASMTNEKHRFNNPSGKRNEKIIASHLSSHLSLNSNELKM
jgi:hypothetical protein